MPHTSKSKVLYLKNRSPDADRLWTLCSSNKESSSWSIEDDAARYQNRILESSDSVSLIIAHNSDCTAELLKCINAHCPDAILFTVGADTYPDVLPDELDHERILRLEQLEQVPILAGHTLVLAKLRAELKIARIHLQRYQNLLTLVPDAVIFEDSKHIITGWNKAAETIFGWSAEETLGKKRSEFLKPRDLIAADVLEAALVMSGACSGELQYITCNGGDVQVFSRRRRQMDHASRVLGWEEVCTETARIRFSEDRVRLLMSLQSLLATPRAVDAAGIDEKLEQFALLAVPQLAQSCIIDLLTEEGLLRRAVIKSRIAGLNAIALELKAEYPMYSGRAFTAGDVLDTGQILTVEKVDDLAEFLGAGTEFQEALNKLPAMPALIAPIIALGKPTGSIILLGAANQASFVDSDAMALKQYAFALGDAIEKSRLDQRLRTESLKTLSVTTYKEAFLGTLSHELRTPLQAMLGWTHLLRSSEFSRAATDKILTALESSINEQGVVISDLLELARVRGGTLELSTRPCKLHTIINSVLVMLDVSITVKQLKVDFKPGQDVWVQADLKWLQRAIWNIFSNATKFTPERGSIAITLLATESHAEITVQDSGAGIPEEFLPHIFECFSQAQSGMKRNYNGLGIGLAVSRQVIEAHGGSVQVFSEGLNKGARFVIRLPLCKAKLDGDTDTTNTAVKEEPLVSELRILLVEGDQDTREIQRFILEQAGAVVAHAPDAQSAFQLIQQGAFDVLIADAQLSDDHGNTLIRKIRALPAKDGGLIPAISLTSETDQASLMEGIKAGFQANLSKPVNPTELLQVVASVARKPI